MPVQTTYPGVYVVEQMTTSHVIVGVSTSVTAFAGAARDLEEELIRSLGVEAILAFAAHCGELTGFRILQRQPAQRDRTVEEQLHRFIGTRAGRKRDYAAGLAATMPLTAVPAPLTALLAGLRG
jgi:hypothetical protein